MEHGVFPVERKKTTYSTRSFGATTLSYTPFSLDAGFGFPDQLADGEPEGCTWYTQNELCQDEDKTVYNRTFVKRKTLEIEGQTNGPCNIFDSLKSTCVYGVQAPNETTDEQAFARKRGRYFQLEKNQGMDWFDSAVAVMQTTGRSLSIASPWFPGFRTPVGGMMPESFPLKWPSEIPGHNHKADGLAVINTQPVIVGKSWQGPLFGDHGKHYWTRKAFNNLMAIDGSGAFMLAPWDGTIQTIQCGIIYRLQVLIAYYRKLLSPWRG